MKIQTTEIKASGTDTFLQYIERETGRWLAVPLDKITQITYFRPVFTITVKR